MRLYQLLQKPLIILIGHCREFAPMNLNRECYPVLNHAYVTRFRGTRRGTISTSGVSCGPTSGEAACTLLVTLLRHSKGTIVGYGLQEPTHAFRTALTRMRRFNPYALRSAPLRRMQPRKRGCGEAPVRQTTFPSPLLQNSRGFTIRPSAPNQPVPGAKTPAGPG